MTTKSSPIRCASAGAVVGLPIAALLWALILYLSH